MWYNTCRLAESMAAYHQTKHLANYWSDIKKMHCQIHHTVYVALINLHSILNLYKCYYSFKDARNEKITIQQSIFDSIWLSLFADQQQRFARADVPKSGLHGGNIKSAIFKCILFFIANLYNYSFRDFRQSKLI